MTILTLTHIKKEFTQGETQIPVLQDVNLTLTQGENCAIIGPSGSGKSTLLHIASLLEHPSAGQIELDGGLIEKKDDKNLSLLRRHKLGFVYQYHHLLSEFTALENIMLPILMNGISRKQAEYRGMSLLVTLGLEHRAHHRPSALSGGEQQRTAIARAIAHKPLLLIADEPTGNLDHKTAQDVFELFIQTIRTEKMTLLMATHNQDFAKKADSLYRLENGRLHKK